MRLRLLLAVIGVVLVLASGSPVGAHTEVQRAAPSPGEVVAAPVDDVELSFLDPVLPTVSIEVTTADGVRVAGLGEVTHSADGREASVSFDPLGAAGAYVVEYDFVAEDGDAQREAYRFTLDTPSDDDGSIAGAAVAVAAAVTIFALGGVALRRRRQRAA